MKYNDIVEKIKGLLEAIGEVQEVYDHAPTELLKYPCIVIRPNGHENQIVSLRDNVREYSFAIDVIGNLDDNNAETQVKLRDLADTVIDVLEKQSNLSLDGVVDWADATSAAFRFQNEPTKIYICEITYRLKVRFNRHA